MESPGLKSMSALRDFFYRQWPNEDRTRPLVCSPSFCDYSKPTFWVISLEGSPPRGTLFIDPHYQTAFLYDGGKMRKVPSNATAAAITFFREWIHDRKGPFCDRDKPFKISSTGSLHDINESV